MKQSLLNALSSLMMDVRYGMSKFNRRNPLLHACSVLAQWYENGITFLRTLQHGLCSLSALAQQNGITFSHTHLTRLALVVALVFGGVNSVWAAYDYNGTGIFKLCTGTLSSGYYVFGGGSTTSVSAVNNTVGSSWVKFTTTTASSNIITNPADAIVWYYDADAGIFQNGTNYIYWPTTKNTGGVGTKNTPVTVTETATSGVYNITVTATPARYFRLNGTSGYRFYASSTGKAEIYFFKMEVASCTENTLEYNNGSCQINTNFDLSTLITGTKNNTSTITYSTSNENNSCTINENTFFANKAGEYTITASQPLTNGICGTDIEFTVTVNATIQFSINGTINSDDTQNLSSGSPTAPNVTDGICSGKVFVGWTTSSIKIAIENKPEYLYTSDELPNVELSGSRTYYAVFATEDGEGGSTPTEESATLSFAGGSGSNQDPISFTDDASGVSAVFTKGTHDTKPRWDESCVRFYGTSTMTNNLTISAPDGATITQISFTTTTSNTMNNATGNGTKVSSNIWSGSANSVEFTTTTQARIEEVTITYVGSGGGPSYSGYVTECGGSTPPTLTPSNPSFEQKRIETTFGSTVTNKLTKEGNGTVTYESSRPAVATVDNTGKVTIRGVGETTITATVEATSTYSGGTATYTLIVNCAKLGTPEGMAQTTSTTNTVSLKWNSVTNVSISNKTSYTVILYENNGTTVKATKTGLTGTSHTFSDLSAGTSYKWTVQAIGNGDTYCSGGVTSQQTATTSADCTTLGTPDVSTLSSSSTDNSITASWEAVANASSYTVVLKDNNGITLQTQTGLTNLYYTFEGLTAGTTYKWTVQAIGNNTTYCDGDILQDKTNQTIKTTNSGSSGGGDTGGSSGNNGYASEGCADEEGWEVLSEYKLSNYDLSTYQECTRETTEKHIDLIIEGINPSDVSKNNIYAAIMKYSHGSHQGYGPHQHLWDYDLDVKNYFYQELVDPTNTYEFCGWKVEGNPKYHHLCEDTDKDPDFISGYYWYTYYETDPTQLVVGLYDKTQYDDVNSHVTITAVYRHRTCVPLINGDDYYFIAPDEPLDCEAPLDLATEVFDYEGTWNFSCTGDNSTRTISDKTITFKEGGNYTITINIPENDSQNLCEVEETFTVCVKPKAPTVTVTAGSKSATVTWDAVIGATSYNVTCTDGTLTRNSDRNYTISGLSAGTNYSVSVTAVGCATGGTGTQNFTTTDLSDYTITVVQAEGGTISNPTDGATAKEDATITLAQTPTAGWQFSGWVVKDANNNPVSVTGNTFTMPASDVTVTATYNKLYDISYSINGSAATSVGQFINGKNILEALADVSVTVPPSCNMQRFIGWTTDEPIVGTPTSKEPTLINENDVINGENVMVYAVFAGVDESTTSNTYTKITNESDLTADHDYLIVGYSNSTYNAFKNSITNDISEVVTVQPDESNVITTSDGNIVWRLTGSADAWKIYNESVGKYLTISSNALILSETAATFSVSVSSGKFSFKTGNDTENTLSYYESKKYFNAYKSANTVYVYKRNVTEVYITKCADCTDSEAKATGGSYLVREIVNLLNHVSSVNTSEKVFTCTSGGATINSDKTLNYNNTTGTYTILFHQDADGTHCEVNKSFDITINPRPTATLTCVTVGNGTISLNPAGGTYEVGSTVIATIEANTGNKIESVVYSGDGTCDLSDDKTTATIVIGASAQTLTATFTKDYGCEETEWVLVTDASTLAAGDELIIASNPKDKTAGTTFNTSNGYISHVKSTFSDDKNRMTSDPNETETMIFELGGQRGAWTLTKQGTVDKLGTKDDVTKLSLGDEVTTTWTIDIAITNHDGDATTPDIVAATIAPSGQTEARILHNTGSRFKTYASALQSNMLLPQLYRRECKVERHNVTTEVRVNGVVTPSAATLLDVPNEVGEGKPANITATAASGYTFAGWEIKSGTGSSIDDVTSSSSVLKMGTSDVALIAHFIEGEWALLTNDYYLQAGDQVLITDNHDGWYRVVGQQTSGKKAFVAEGINYSDDKLKVTYLSRNATIFTMGGSHGAWQFLSSTNKLSANGDENLGFDTTNVDWTIDYSELTSTRIAANGHDLYHRAIPDGYFSAYTSINSRPLNKPSIYYKVNTTTPRLEVSPLRMTGFTYPDANGVPELEIDVESAVQKIDRHYVYNTTDNAEVQIRVSEYYEISSAKFEKFSSSMDLTAKQFREFTLWVHLKKGLPVGTYSGRITFNTAGAEERVIILEGEVTAPEKAMITFNNNGTTTSQIVTIGTTATEPETPTVCAGYTFVGWTEETSIVDEQTAPTLFDFDTPIDKDYTLYAVYSYKGKTQQTIYQPTTELPAVGASKEYLLVQKKDDVYYAVGCNTTTQTNKSLPAVTLSDVLEETIYPISITDDKCYWIISQTTSGVFTLQNKSTEYYVTQTNKDATEAINLSASGSIKIEIDGDVCKIGCLQDRYLGYSTDFRMYNAATKLKLYASTEIPIITTLYTMTPNCDPILLITTTEDMYLTGGVGTGLDATRSTVQAQKIIEFEGYRLKGSGSNEPIVKVTATKIIDEDGNNTTGVSINLDNQTVVADDAGSTYTITGSAVVTYEPTEVGTTHDVTLPFHVEYNTTAADTKQDYIVHTRSLPSSFVIAAKDGDKWYALPANMPQSGTYSPIEITDKVSAGVVTEIDVTNVYTFDGMKNGGEEQYIRFIGHDGAYLWGQNANNTGISNNAKESPDSNSSTYNWLLRTSDNETYSITNAVQVGNNSGRVLSISSNKWGMYDKDPEIHILPVSHVTINEDTEFFIGGTDCDVTVAADKTLTIPANAKAIANAKDLVVDAGGKVKVSENGTFNTASVTLRSEGDKVPHLVLPSTTSLLISKTNTLKFIKHVESGRYFFFSLPYNCTMADVMNANSTIRSTYGKDWLIITYDGANRSLGREDDSSWPAVESGVLNAGQGYALADDKGRDIVFPMTLDHGNLHELDNIEKSIPIEAHGFTGGKPTRDDIAHNHLGWNFVGNPYFTTYGEIADEDLKTGELQYNKDAHMDTWVEDGFIYLSILYEGQDEYYDQAKASDVTLPPFSAFFVQVNQGTSLDYLLGEKKKEIAARLAPEQNSAKTIFAGVSLTLDSLTDKTSLVINNRYTQEYEIGADLEKMLGRGNRPQVYVVDDNYKYAFKSLNEHDAAGINMLGVYLPAQGTYTFDVIRNYDLSDVQGIFLMDYEARRSVNLMKQPYTFTSGKLNSEARFSLSVVMAPKTVTSLTDIEAAWSVWQSGELTLSMMGLTEGEQVRVVDVTGKLVTTFTAEDNTATIGVPTHGAYCVMAGGAVKKVIVH